MDIEPSKTACHRFSSTAISESGGFDFLGFTFRWRMARSGNPTVGRTTSAKALHRSLAAYTTWIREARSWPRKMLFASLRRKMQGYWGYYGLRGNSLRLQKIWNHIVLITHRWLNRCSQRTSYTLRGLTAVLKASGVPAPKISEPPRIRKPFLWQIA